MNDNKGLIYKKMANVYAKVEAISKEKTNKEQNFKFRGIDDVYNTLHRVFAEEGIFLTPENISTSRNQVVSKSGTNGYHTISLIKFTFYAEDGSSVSALAEGESIDYGDKSTGKSQSMAIKQALLQTFMIPTEDTEDGDKTSPEAGKPPVKPTPPAEKPKADVTPAALKNEAGEIELQPGKHDEAMKFLNDVQTEAMLKGFISNRDKRTWTPEELKEQNAAIAALRAQWKAEADIKNTK